MYAEQLKAARKRHADATSKREELENLAKSVQAYSDDVERIHGELEHKIPTLIRQIAADKESPQALELVAAQMGVSTVELVREHAPKVISSIKSEETNFANVQQWANNDIRDISHKMMADEIKAAEPTARGSDSVRVRAETIVSKLKPRFPSIDVNDVSRVLGWKLA